MVAGRGSYARQVERELVRAARRQRPGHGQLRRAADDPHVIAERFTLRPGWDEAVDGRAPRLSSTETIAVSTDGRFAGTDPLQVVVGWRSLGRVLGLAVLGAGVGLSWWRGARWGTGPLASLGGRDAHR
jgi:hypothetical protein